MGTTALRRGIGILTAIASIAASATYAGAGAIKLETATPAQGPESTAVVKITDESGTQDVSAFQFKLYFNSEQATPVSVASGQIVDGGSVTFGAYDEDPNDGIPPSTIVHPASGAPAGLDSYVVIIGDVTENNWTDRGDLALVTLQTAETFTGHLDLWLQPDGPEGMSYLYIDGNAEEHPIVATFDEDPTVSYGSPQIASIDKDGTWTGHGVEVQVTGTGFFSDGAAGPAPDTVFTYNGETLTPISVNESGTVATIMIPSFDPLAPGTDYLDAPLTASNGVGYDTDAITFTLVERNNVYADVVWSGEPTYKRVANGRIMGGNAFGAIQPAVTAVKLNGSVHVAEGRYAENINVVTHAMNIIGAGKEQSIITATGPAANQKLMTITADGVNVSHLGFEFSADVNAGVRVASDGVAVTDCDFKVVALHEIPTDPEAVNPRRYPAETVADRSFVGDWGARGITFHGGGTDHTNMDTVTIQRNTFTKTVTEAKAFARSIMILNGHAIIGGEIEADGNVSGEAVAYRDLDMRQRSFGEIKNNQFATNVDVNGSFGPVVLSDNTFGNGPSFLSNEAALTIRAVSNENASVTVSGNHFEQTARGVWVGGSSQLVTIEGNDFTPAASISSANLILDDLALPDDPSKSRYYEELELTDDRYSHIMIDSRNTTSNGTRDTNVSVSNNTFNDSAADGSAIQLKNLGSNVMTLSFAGNNFGHLDGPADNYVQVDGSFTDTVNLTSSKVSVASGVEPAAISASWDLDDLFAVEDHTFHKLDENGTGLVRWVDQRIYVTDLSDKIQRGVDAATAGDTVHVQDADYVESNILVSKPLTVVGQSRDGVVVAPVAIAPVTVFGNDFGANHQHGFIVGANSVTIQDLTIDGMANNVALGSTGRNYLAGVLHAYPEGDFAGTTVDNVAIKNVEFYGVKLSRDTRGGDANLITGSEFSGLRPNRYAVHATNADVDMLLSHVYGSGGIWGNATSLANYIQVTVQGNTFTEGTAGNTAINLIGVSGAVIGGPDNDEERNVIDLQNGRYNSYGITVAYATGPVTIENNIIDCDRSDTGILLAHNEDPSNPVHVKNNQISSVDPGDFVYDNRGAGVLATDDDGLLNSGEDGASYAVLTGNQIDGFRYGVYLRRAGTIGGGRPVSVIIGGTDEDAENTITNCYTAIRVHDADGPDNDGDYDAYALIRNAATLIDGGELGIDVNGGSADISNIAINNFDMGVTVRNGGQAAVNGNHLSGNTHHFAFEVTNTNDSSIEVGSQTYNPSARSAGELEAIVLANNVDGKTYISSDTGDAQGDVVAEYLGEEQFVIVRNTIQGSIDAPADVAAGNTVKVMADVYDESVRLVHTLRLQGTGSETFPSVISPTPANYGGNELAAVALVAPGCIVDGFEVTRTLAGSDSEWGGSKPMYSGISMQTNGGHRISNNLVTNYWNGLYVNNSQNNILSGNALQNNRHGIQMANNVTGSKINNNTITGNWFSGIGLNEPPQDHILETLNLEVRDNNISGNMAYEVSCEWADGKNHVLDFSGNYFGTVAITVDEDAPDHGALDLTPFPTVAHIATFGGTDVKRLIDYNAYLASDDNSAASPLAFEGDFSTLYLAPTPLAGTERSHIHDAVELLENGELEEGNRQILVNAGTYIDSAAEVDKPVQIVGVEADRTAAVFNPLYSSQNGIVIAASDVRIEGLTIAGTGATPYRSAIYRGTGALHNNTSLINVAVANAGVADTVGAVELRQPVSGPNSTGNVVQGSEFTNSTYTSLRLLGGVTTVDDNDFVGGSYQGLFVGKAGAGGAGEAGVAVVTDNDFEGFLYPVRLSGAGDGTIIGGGQPGDGNRFDLGINGLPSVGVSVEHSGVPVQNNTFTYTNNATFLGSGSVGVYNWYTVGGSVIEDNTFKAAAAGNPGIGVLAIGRRDYPLGAGEENKTVAFVGNNLFQNLHAGVYARNSDSDNTAVEVVVDGVDQTEVGGVAASGFVNTANGVLVDGTHATVAVRNNEFGASNTNAITFTNASAASVIEGNTFGAIATATQKYIVNTSGNDYEIAANTFGDVTPATVFAEVDGDNTTALNQFYTIQAGLVDALNETDNGHLVFVPGYVFVPNGKVGTDDAGNGLIHRAGLVAKDGSFLALQGGDYADAPATINKHVSIVSPGADVVDLLGVRTLGIGRHAANVQQPLTLELNDSGQLAVVAGLKFTGGGSLTFADVEGATLNSGIVGVLYSEFSGLANNSTAITMDRLSGSARKVIYDNDITDSGAGILLRNSQGTEAEPLLVMLNEIHDNYDTGIAINKTNYTGLADNGITPNHIAIVGNNITGSGLVNEDTDESLQNYNAYGIFAGAFDEGATVIPSATKPFSHDLRIQGNTVTDNAATGVALWYTNSDGASDSLTEIKLNTIERNGIYRKGEQYGTPDFPKHSTDGLKLRHSQNVKVEHNVIRDNQRNNVLVEGDANEDGTGEGILLVSNHLDNNQPIVNYPDTAPAIGGGLMVQNAANTAVNIEGNWWGHVYGPQYDANPRGRGAKIVLNTGSVNAGQWYGYRDHANRFFALNDSDGDGALNALEDKDLSGDETDAAWGTETLVGHYPNAAGSKDFDGDGFEDGVELLAGSDPRNADSTPLDPAGDGTEPAADWAQYASYDTYGEVDDGSGGVKKVGSDKDSDSDGYLDFYEVAMGTDPEDSDSKPTLGRVKTDEAERTTAQVSWLRQLMVGSRQFDDPTPNPADKSGYRTNQDNADVNRNGVVNNADLVFMRRFINQQSVTSLPVMPASTPSGPDTTP